MKTLADRLQLAKTVLIQISRQPIRRRALEIIVTQKGSTHHQFNGILHFLADSGYIQKDAAKRFAKYFITEKGCKLLEAL